MGRAAAGNGALRNVLVHLDGSDAARQRLRLAHRVGRRFGAHLYALFCVEPTIAALRLAISEAPAALFETQEGTALRRARRWFDEEAGAARAATWLEAEGDDACAAFLRQARLADLAIVGQSDEDTSGEARIPEAVIWGTGKPVLVIPSFGNVKPIGTTVLVGWKSGREAARAVNDALPFLSRAKSVTVLAIDPEKGISGEGAVPAADIALHLARHGVTATAAHTISTGIGEGDVLLNYASDLGADLIVAGGYGHSRAREFVLGGATRSLLGTMTVPVLFSH